MENIEMNRQDPMPMPDRENGDVQLAFVYAPSQAFRMMTTPTEALMRGTLFDELYKPLERKGGFYR